MKIAHKVIIINISHIALMAILFYSAYQNTDIVVAKFHYEEIADSLNLSFNDIRDFEKNYLLYGDESALSPIEQKLRESLHTLNSMRMDIIRAINLRNFGQLSSAIEHYMGIIRQARAHRPGDVHMQRSIQEAGQRLREVSDDIHRLERTKARRTLSVYKKVLFYSFCIIVLIATGLSYRFFSPIFKSLRTVESAADEISKGNFGRIEGKISRDEMGSVLNAMNSMSDELKFREEQILQQKKIESLGIITAGVAHELGNPLNNMSMLAQVYRELYDDLSKEQRLQYMEEIGDEIDRIREIVADLLDFSKPQKTDFKEVGINKVIEKSLKLVRNMIHISGIELELTLQEGLPHVLMDEHAIQGVLVNLTTNAIQAMSPGGKLSISVSLAQERDFIQVEIADTGCGMSSEVLAHIFDPFFSTKGARGTGLGLSVSYGTIKNHQGNIKVQSKVGSGTRFTIELPIYKGRERDHERSPNYGDR